MLEGNDIELVSNSGETCPQPQCACFVTRCNECFFISVGHIFRGCPKYLVELKLLRLNVFLKSTCLNVFFRWQILLCIMYTWSKWFLRIVNIVIALDRMV